MAGPTTMDAQPIYDQLVAEWAKSNPDLNRLGQLIAQLKVALASIAYMPSTDRASQNELLMTRHVLEIGAFWSIKAQDTPSFERFISQLKAFYFDLANVLPVSQNQSELLGLNLLCLLAQNRISDFHIELELLDPKELHNNKYLNHPVAVEQYLMEGAYNRVFKTRTDIPADSYAFFHDTLADTVREEITACCEQAFSQLAPGDLRKLLFLDRDEDALRFIEKRQWKFVDGAYKFEAPAKTVSKTDIPADGLIAKSMQYARELEKIV